MKKIVITIGILVMISFALLYLKKKEIVSDKLELSISEDENGTVLLNSNIEFNDYDYCVINYMEDEVDYTIIFLKLYDNFHLRHFNHNGTAEYQTVLFYSNSDAKTSEAYSLKDFDGIYYLVDNYKNYSNLSNDEIVEKIKNSTVIWENDKE